MQVTLTDMKVGVLPYSDGSGFRFELTMNADGKITIHQAGSFIEMDREECKKVMNALDALWATADEIARAA